MINQAKSRIQTEIEILGMLEKLSVNVLTDN